MLELAFQLCGISPQRCSGRGLGGEATTSMATREKKPEDMFWACESRESEGLGISLDVWGRAEGGTRGDLQVSAQMVTFSEGRNMGKRTNLGGKVIKIGVC